MIISLFFWETNKGRNEGRREGREGGRKRRREEKKRKQGRKECDLKSTLNYESQPTGKAELLFANVVSTRGSGGLFNLIKWENRRPQKDLFQAMYQVAI